MVPSQNVVFKNTVKNVVETGCDDKSEIWYGTAYPTFTFAGHILPKGCKGCTGLCVWNAPNYQNRSNPKNRSRWHFGVGLTLDLTMLANIFVISEGVRVGSEIGSPKNFGWVRGPVVIQQVRYDLLSEWKNNKVYCQAGFCCNALYCTPQQLSISRQCVHNTLFLINKFA